MSSSKELADFGARLGALISHREAFRTISDACFNDLARELFSRQFATNNGYGRFCERRGVSPQTLNHWTEIPAIPTAGFKEFELTSIPPQERTRVFYSSGTSNQQPSRHFHSPASLELYEASLWRWFEVCAAVPKKVNLVSLTPPAAATPNSSLVHMFETLCGCLGAETSVFTGEVDDSGAWRVEKEPTIRALEASAEEQTPVLLVGTAFLFVNFLDAIGPAKRSLRLPPGSKILETGGYKGRSRVLSKPELHREITQAFGVAESRIICEYGMSELSSQAYELSHAHSLAFQFPPWARAQVISPENGCEVPEGQRGLLRICDLANVYSVMAIQTEDLAVRRGNGFELIGRAPASEARGCSLMAA